MAWILLRFAASIQHEVNGICPRGGRMKGTRAQQTARRNSPARIRRVAAAAAMIAALGIGAMACARPGPGSAKTPDELLTQLNQDRTDIDQASQTMMKRIDMFNTSRKPGEKTLQFSEVFAADLSPEQQDVLNTMVAEEKDFSYKTLLQKIIVDRDQIRDMQAKLMHLEQTLPDKFVVAKRGDRQQNMAMAYLRGEGQEPPQAGRPDGRADPGQQGLVLL
jgi:hypothetical protein